MSAKVVFSGMRPTGKLQIGNYWGALKNWIELTEDHACYYSVVDYHMLTTGYEDTSNLQENIRDMVLDWLAAGLDPKKCVIFKQSDVHEHAELALILGMVTPVSWLENNPTWKEQLQELSKSKQTRTIESVSGLPGKAGVAAPKIAKDILSDKEIDPSLRTFGFLGYPVLQAADILLYRGTRVPVGQDQLPHIELSREIARRFNGKFGDVFPEPQPILTPTPKVPGLDGRKMSKSYGNTMELYESRESLKKKVMSMYTDPSRSKKTSPGHPEPCEENPPGCSVYALHKLYSDDGEFVEKRGAECREGRVGCVACKKDLLASLEGPFSDFREAREKLAADKGLVDGILEDGAKRARAVAQNTMKDVRRAMRL